GGGSRTNGRRRGHRRLVPGDAIAVVADGQLVPGLEPSFRDAHPVDADAVGAVQVANDEVVIDLGDAAVAARNLARIDLDVALWMAAEEQDRLVHQDAGSFVQRHELSRHEWAPVSSSTSQAPPGNYTTPRGTPST